MPPTHAAPAPLWMPLLALLAGVLGMSAVWATLAILSQAPLAWMAWIAALDLLLLLHLTGVAAGGRRAGLALAGTAACITLSYWFIAATQLGSQLGLMPLQSALRLGPALMLELSRLQAGRWDPALLGSALLLAGFAGYGRRR